MKSKLEIYALAVCFASVVCLIIASSIGGYALFKIAAPELTMSTYLYDKHQTNDDYWKANKCCSKKKEENTRPSEKDITQQRLESFSIKTRSEQREGFQSLIRSLIFILVGALTLFIHWRIAKHSREQ
jgi:hypothetical protein